MDDGLQINQNDISGHLLSLFKNLIVERNVLLSMVKSLILFFNGTFASHKNLGLIQDSKLYFSNHVDQKVKIAPDWIGIIKSSF